MKKIIVTLFAISTMSASAAPKLKCELSQLDNNQVINNFEINPARDSFILVNKETLKNILLVGEDNEIPEEIGTSPSIIGFSKIAFGVKIGSLNLDPQGEVGFTSSKKFLEEDKIEFQSKADNLIIRCERTNSL